METSVQRQPSVEVEGFSGPFDLLARLIERRELDVLTISLAAVTEQYLDHLAAARLRDPEHLSAFLVVAAKLLLIKSSLLLPTGPRSSSGEDRSPDPTDLTERLREYQAYRQAGEWLARRDESGLRSHVRPPVVYRPTVVARPPSQDPFLLREAMARALSRPKPEPDPIPMAVEPRLSVADALTILRTALERAATVRFSELLANPTDRGHRVAIFLALLEAVRQGLVVAKQDRRFGEIEISREPSPDAPAPLGGSAG